MPEAAPYGFSLDQIMQALTEEGERQRRNRVGDPSSVAAMLLEEKARRAGQLPQAGGAPFGMPSLPQMPNNGLPGTSIGPTPERRALAAPLVTPRGSSEPELGLPGMVTEPIQAFGRALAKSNAGARPSELTPEATNIALSMGGASSIGSRPAGSLGIFLGRPQAERLAKEGRPAALAALDTAEKMEARGASDREIRQAAHAIFRRDEKNFGTVWKPHPDEPWRFEIADDMSRLAPTGPELAPLGPQFKHPDLMAAMPGMANVELRRVPGQTIVPGRTVFGRHTPGIPETGLPSEISIAQGASARRNNLIAELQHEVQFQNNSPRGGSSDEFRPGGGLEQHLLKGEDPKQAYGRLLGEIESKVAKARSRLTPQQLRSTPVEKTIERMQSLEALPLGPPIITRYKRGGRPPSFNEEDEFADMARKGFARDQAIANSKQQPARGLTNAAREQLSREDALGRQAEAMAKQARGLVQTMRAAGQAPEAIAAELTKRYRTPVDPQQIISGNGWWNAGGTSARAGTRGPFWTPEERQLFTELYKQGTSYKGIADKIREFSGRHLIPTSVHQTRARFGLSARQGERTAEGSPFTRQVNLAIAQMVQKATPVHQIAAELTKQFGQRYAPAAVGNQIASLKLIPRNPGMKTNAPSWQPDALAILKDTDRIKGMTGQQIADLIYKETGQVATRNSVLGRRLRLREEQMRAELAEDLAKAKGD